ncbi:hypothetical protein BJ956_001940 [Arthrobacter psychrochitiniphilus]|nr:hypothetical protein [Arthrobacter psychrochitiniphilus]
MIDQCEAVGQADGALTPTTFCFGASEAGSVPGNDTEALLLPAGLLIRPPSHAGPDSPVSATMGSGLQRNSGWR